MARRESTILGMLGDLRLLLDALTASSEDLPHLESWRARLEGLLTQAHEAAGRRAAAAAEKQEATRDLQTLLTDGNRLAAALRGVIKEHYGPRAEDLTKFGMKPFRGRKRKKEGEEPGASPEG
jgi:hypothetical protein